MKRPYPKKRRDRRTGLAPYTKYGKRPHVYSEAYRHWKAAIMRKETRYEPQA